MAGSRSTRPACDPAEPSPDRAPDSLAAGIAQPLRGELEALLGADRVLARPGDLVKYASDASPYRLSPAAVVMAKEADDVAKVLAFGRERGIPVTFRAGGTSLNGQGQTDGILVDVRRHFGGIAVLEDGAAVRVGTGTILGHVNRVLAPHGRRLGPDPASTDVATRRRRRRQQLGRDALRGDQGLLLDPALADLRPPLGDPDRHRRARRRRRVRRGRAGARRGPGRDPRRDPRRRRAHRPHPPQVRDQEHDRLPPLRLPRRRRAAGDLPPPAGRLGGDARLRPRGRLRDRRRSRR